VAGARLKRFLLVVLIVSLVAAALVSVGVFVLGGTGDLEARALLTVLLLGFFSLTGLCAAVRFERGLAGLGWLGVLVSLAGLTYSELLVWRVIPVEGFSAIKPALSLAVGALALGYGSLLLLARGPYRSVNAVTWLTLLLVAVLAGGLIGFIVTEIEPPPELSRGTAAVAILAVLGTMLAPILLKFLSLGGAPPPPGRESDRRGRHRARKGERRQEAKGV
jgi:hypothetical protein